MKKVITTVLSLSLLMGGAAFAQGTDTTKTDTNTMGGTTKKHHRHKKSAGTDTASSTATSTSK